MAPGLRADQHVVRVGPEGGRRSPAAILRLRRDRGRNGLPVAGALQRPRAAAGKATRRRAASPQSHRRRRRLPAVLAGGAAMGGPDQARISLWPGRLRHEVARPRPGLRPCAPQAPRHRARNRHPVSRRGGRRERRALGSAVAAREPSGVVFGGPRGLERGRNDGSPPAGGGFLGARNGPGRLRPARVRGLERGAASRRWPRGIRKSYRLRSRPTLRSSSASTFSPTAWRRR